MDDGVFFGTVLGRGEWLIGNKLPWNHPGYEPEPHHPTGLMVKYWIAHENDPDATYRGQGHQAQLPAHGRRRELVQVFSGQFLCNGRLLRAGDYVEFAADEARTWKLSPDCLLAAGVTLCCFANHIMGNSGAGFVYRVINQAQNSNWEQALEAPPGSWIYQLVMVFSGGVVLSLNDEEHCLDTGDYGFVGQKHARNCSWYPLNNAVAAVLWY